jgi:hypothetical protein
VAVAVLGSGVKKSAQATLFSPQTMYAPASGAAIAQGVIQQDIFQNVKSGDVAPQVYKHLPDLPQENHYVNKETGKVDSDNTLVKRLIRYHIYVKGRPPIYRLDWKLTMADYLGANEHMEQSQYPGADNLQQNPIEGDRAAISRLNRTQRDALVQVLVNIFNPKSSNPTPAPSAATQPRATPKPSATSPASPQPGAAHLLMP